MDTPYVPVNCEFHDVLEATATRKHIVTIVYTDEHGVLQEVPARVVDIVAEHGVEYALLEPAQRLRLDRLVSVAGTRLDAFGA